MNNFRNMILKTRLSLRQTIGLPSIQIKRLKAAFTGCAKMSCIVILSEAKNLSSIYASENKPREILRFAQNDSVFIFP